MMFGVSLKAIFNWAALIVGAVSAVFWVLAARSRVRAKAGMKDGTYYGTVVADGNDLIKTVSLQSKWNSRAAFAAAATVGLQIVASLIPE